MWPAVFLLAVSFLLLTLPGSAFPNETWLSKIYFDKWVHIGLFASLTWVFCKYMALNKGKRAAAVFLMVAIAATAYGLAMEFVQRDFITNRSFDMGDVVADAGGSLLGAFLSFGWYAKK